jgi:hypothetical protein
MITSAVERRSSNEFDDGIGNGRVWPSAS